MKVENIFKKDFIKNSIILVSLLQLVVTCVFTWQYYLYLNGLRSFFNVSLSSPVTGGIWVMTSLCLFSGLTIFFIFQYIKVSKLESELSEAKLLNKTSEETIKLLRCHRHDFLNHLQVVMGYVQLKKYDKVKDYIITINNELTEVRKVSGLKVPEVAVLLLNKKQEALRHEIDLIYSIDNDLTYLGSKISHIDIIRILGNLIDNAMFELKKTNDPPKKINVNINIKNNKLFLEVSNTNSYIKNTKTIFDYGYTTKKDKGTGLGLYIIKELVEKKYKGHINLTSNKQLGTTFQIVI